MSPSLQLGDRLGWSVAAVLLLAEAIGMGTAATPLLLLAALLALLGVWMGDGPPPPRLQLAIMGLLALGLVAVGLQDLASPPTDEVAFVGAGARMVLHGLDPYAHALAVPVGHVAGVTPRLDGTTVDGLTYPALSFLVYIPFELVGLGARAVPVADLVAWIGAALLLWRLAPVGARWVSALFLGLPVFAAAAVRSTDAVFVPLLMVALCRWDRYADPDEHGPARWLGPVALGAAMAVKQQPWLFLPFLLVGVGIESTRRCGRGGQVVGRYALTAFGVFLVPNLPFLIAGPREWLTQVLAPLVQPLVPSGNGLVATLTERGGADLRLLTVASAAFLLLSLVVLGAFYDRVKPCWPLLIPMAFFWATRSLATYFLDLLPVVIVGILSVRSASPRAQVRPSRRAGVALGAVATLFVGSVLAALVIPPPLRLSVDSVHTDPHSGAVDAAVVSVTNSTGSRVAPWFNVGGAGASPWSAETMDGRPMGALAPHSTTRIRLVAPAAGVLPGADAPVVVDAYAPRPASMAWARYQTPLAGTGTAVPAAARRPTEP